MFLNDEGPRAKSRLQSLRSGASAICFLMSAAVAIPTILFIDDGFASDGRTPVDVGLSGIIGFGLFGGIAALHNWGINGLPEMPRSARARATAVYFTVASIVAGVSGTTSIQFVAGPGAELATLERTIDETSEDRAALQAALGMVVTSRQAIGGAVSASAALLEAEETSGGLCQTGRNRGPCTSAIESVGASLVRADREINQSLAEIAPLMHQAETLFDQVERIAKSDRLTASERLKALRDESEALAGVQREIYAAMPFPAMEAARATLARDFTTIGLSNVGGERLNAEFQPYATLVHASIDGARAAISDPPHQTEKMSVLEMIGREFDDVGLLACALALLELIPMALVLLVLISSPIKDDPPSSPFDDDFYDPGSAARRRSHPRLRIV